MGNSWIPNHCWGKTHISQPGFPTTLFVQTKFVQKSIWLGMCHATTFDFPTIQIFPTINPIVASSQHYSSTNYYFSTSDVYVCPSFFLDVRLSFYTKNSRLNVFTRMTYRFMLLKAIDKFFKILDVQSGCQLKSLLAVSFGFGKARMFGLSMSLLF